MKISDTVVGAGFVAAGALIFAGTLNYPTLEAGHPGPSLFPRILGGLMAVFGGLVSLLGLRARDVTDEVAWLRLHKNPAFINALVVLAGVLAYIFLVEHLGFLIMGALVIFTLMWRLQVRPVKAAVVAIVFNTLVHFLFAKVLRVPLPLGILWW
ncbi:MAG: tripartite tricarboxylate transporter TctB family protein [candidate division NC10 bacterium]|nr:tripartite tricarboxylate transporter TctB family protein [candidate division NC10 bacterium]MBI2113758.1 tripartite tricarboxylate transporter TctB family protein [candidate division NC10 bacterium]MBI3085873.1 tripartite tricarboxylate transporter TctB family protein [candidate division NC10 bacterium]